MSLKCVLLCGEFYIVGITSNTLSSLVICRVRAILIDVTQLFGHTTMLSKTFTSFTRQFSSAPVWKQVSLTFFTKETCLLCKNADAILNQVLAEGDLKNTKLQKVDIMDPSNSAAFDKYCYDVPVLHVDRPGQAKPVKFMHYFDAEKIAQELRRAA